MRPAATGAASSPVAGSGVVLPLIALSELELSIGGAIDARDKEGKWVEAKIKKLSASERTPAADDHTRAPFTCDRSKVRFVRVNFVGWDAKWDEWISVVPSSHHSLRLQPAGRFTSGNGTKPNLGDRFRLQSEVFVYRVSPLPRIWNVAKVIDTDGRQIRVQFFPEAPIAPSTAGAPNAKRDYWFHTASDEVWHGDPYIQSSAIPAPASAARLSVSAKTATAATATAATSSTASTNGSGSTASSSSASTAAKSLAIAAAVNHAAAATAAATAGSTPMLVSPKSNGAATTPAANGNGSVHTHSRTATPPSPFSAAKAAAASAQAAGAVPKLSLAADDFDVFKLVKSEKSLDIRDRDGRWRPATILDRTTAAAAASANGKTAADRTFGSAAVSKVQIRYLDVSDPSSVDAKEWIDLDRASYRIQPFQRCSAAAPNGSPFEYRVNDSVFVSPPTASLVPSGMNAVWLSGVVRAVAPPQVLVEYTPPAAAPNTIAAPRGSVSVPPPAAARTAKREWFHPLFQHVCKELPAGATVSSTASTATLPSNGRTPPLSPSNLNLRSLSVTSPGKPDTASTKPNGTAAAAAAAVVIASTPTTGAGSGPAVLRTSSILTPAPQLISVSDLKPRATVDARDNIGKWIKAEVMSIVPATAMEPFAQVFVHYVGWDPKWDEMLPVDDKQRALNPRLARLGCYSASSTTNTFREDETVYVLATPPRDAARYVEVSTPASTPAGASIVPFRWWAVDGWISGRVLQRELAQLYVEYTPDPVTAAYSQPSQYSQSPSQNGGTVKRWFHLDRNEIRSTKVPLPAFPTPAATPATVNKKLSVSTNGSTSAAAAAAVVIPATPTGKSQSSTGTGGQVLVSGPLGTLSIPPPIPTLTPSVGLVCDCRDRDGRWCEAKVVGQHQDGRWRIHFLDWDSKYDEDLTTAQFSLRSAPYYSFTPTLTARFLSGVHKSVSAQLYKTIGSSLFEQHYHTVGTRVYVFRCVPEPRTWIEATIRKFEPLTMHVQVQYPIPATAALPAGQFAAWFHALSGEILPVHPNTVLSPDSPCALAAVPSPSTAAVSASNKASNLFQYVHTVITRRAAVLAATATPDKATDKKSAANKMVDVDADDALDDDERAMTPAGKTGSGEDPLREWANASITKQMEKKSPYDFRGLVGIRNVGNSCYLNAAVQAICALPPVINFFVHKRAHHQLSLSNPRAVSHTKTRGRLVPEFAFLAERLYECEPEAGAHFAVLSPAGLKHVISALADRFGGYDQQDSHEFLNVLLDGLHHELNITGASGEAKSVTYPAAIMDTSFTAAMAATGKPEAAAIRADKTWKRHLMYNQSIISTLFYGLLQNKTTCATCAYTSLAFETFSSISLDLPSSKGKWSLFSGSVTLAQCFEEFTRAEKLGGGDWFCENCKARRNATKQLLLWSLPPVLFVQLKRFAPDGSRVNSGVEYPLELNVKDWCDPAARTAAQSNPTAAKPESGLPAFPAYPLAGSSSYRLHSVVLHYGRYRHYTAVTKVRMTRRGETAPSDVAWVEFDDRQLTDASESGLASAVARESVYLLMYVKG